MVDTQLQKSLEIQPGRRFAMRYRLERLIAHGGMATVWLATDEQLRRPVAVKLLHEHLRDPISVERFRGEGKLAAQLCHPGIVAIYDTFHDHGIDGIVLEYVHGRTLRARLDDGSPMSVEEATIIAQSVATALAEAHRRGLIHRDIKPANILLGERGAVKVTDFGIAKLLDGSDLTQPGTVVGTAKYLAPEQLTGNPLDGRADVYALGVVLYEMLAGVAPFVSDTDAATAIARLQMPAPSLRRHRPDLPHELADLVDRMLERAPARRPDTASVANALAAHLAAVATPSLTLPRMVSVRAPARHPRVPLLIASAFVLIALTVAGVLVGRTDAGRGLREKLGLENSSPTSPNTAIPLGSATIASFDPAAQDGVEHPELVTFLTDGKQATVWTTEKYANRDFGGLKAGIGIVIDLGRAITVSELRVRGASSGWSASVYIADGAADTIDSWGNARARRGNVAGEAAFTFPPTRGRTVLLWITDLGDTAQVRIGELELRGPT